MCVRFGLSLEDFVCYYPRHNQKADSRILRNYLYGRLLVFSQGSIDGRGQNRLRLRAVFFFAALNPPVGAGGSDPSSQP